MLFVPLGDENGLLLLRDELGEELVWAGDRSHAPDALTPRASFETWKESVHGMALPWSEPQLQEAARFGRNLELRLDNLELERLAVEDELTGLLRAKDTIARLGGDEFAIVQYHVQEPPAVALVAERIVAELHRPFQLEEGEAGIGASVGIALYPRHGTTSDTLLEKADAALYAVKHSGRNGWRQWEEGL